MDRVQPVVAGQRHVGAGRGDALLADGMPTGPTFGEVLEQVYDAQLEGRVRTAEEALHLARQLAAR